MVRRRIAFDADPVSFGNRFDAAETALQQRILSAQARLSSVRLTDESLTAIAEVCAAFEVDGMRADIVTARAAVAHAAWHQRDQVIRADIRAAARLALPHRRRRNPFDAPGLDEDLLDQLLGPDEPEDEPEPDPHRPDPDPDGAGPDRPEDAGEGPAAPADVGGDGSSSAPPDVPPDRAESASSPDHGADAQVAGGVTPTLVAKAAAPYRTRWFSATGVGAGEAGKRSRAITATGRTIGAAQHSRRPTPIHLAATLRAAAPHQLSRGRSSGRLQLHPDDLRTAVTEGRESNLVLLCVDASGSMAARRRMEAVKTAALSLLLDAYQRRDKVGLITFRGSSATLALPPTSSVDTAARRLDELPSGGRTPLAEGLLCAAETLRLERIKDPRRRPLLIVITDGRATSGQSPLARAQQAAEFLRTAAVSTIVIDCETGKLLLGLAHDLSVRLDAEYVRVSEIGADSIVAAVGTSRGAGTGRAA